MDTIKRVQDLMQVRDMNLCVLAKKCGISYSTIQTTARRGGQLSVETIERICQGLGITSLFNCIGFSNVGFSCVGFSNVGFSNVGETDAGTGCGSSKIT